MESLTSSRYDVNLINHYIACILTSVKKQKLQAESIAYPLLGQFDSNYKEAQEYRTER